MLSKYSLFLIGLNHKCILLLLLSCLIGLKVYATHYRAGEIYYENIGGRNYRITATTFTDPNSNANQFTTQLTIFWGDGTSNVVMRTQRIEISVTVQKNVYQFTHTYPSDGNFVVSFSDPNRVADIRNINNGIRTDDIPFYVESLIKVSSAIGNNNSPILRVPPIVDGCEDFFYLHNPGAYDPDGDSLVFSLDVPKQGRNDPVPNYTNPAATDSFTIDFRTGKVYWVKPVTIGFYNIAIRVTEYRNGEIVGYVVRDMQIRINTCINNPPVITDVADQCVIAGDSVRLDINANDPDGNSTQTITLTGYGGPFELPNSPAILNPKNPTGIAFVTGRFLWNTICQHIRYQSYPATIEAIDNFSTPMANYLTFTIKVIPPKPTQLSLKQRGNGFMIRWNRDTCLLADQYLIYRKVDSSFWNPGKCETGMKDGLGFTLIGTINGISNLATDTFFYDDNNGEGLSPLVNYCYRIVAKYPARNAFGANVPGGIKPVSIASDEVCDAIIRSKPIITHVSIINTDAIKGSLRLAWLRPDTLDTLVYKSPYKLVVKRAIRSSELGPTYTPIRTLDYPFFNSFNDTSIIDSGLNTLINQYQYEIDLLWDSLGIPTFVDKSPMASSLRASVYSTDNTNIISWNAKVPWVNAQYTVFRQNKTTLLFDSIVTTSLNSYPDTGLINEEEYCYYVQSSGGYSFYDSVLINLSQRICGTPIDTIKPCAPPLTVIPPCEGFNNFSNELVWQPPQRCGNDIMKYRIYFKKQPNDTFQWIGEVDNTVFQFKDGRDELRFSIAGCYAVTGIDSFNNESNFTNVRCIDNCPFYDIPNVFTPDGDGRNDVLNPFPYRFISSIKLQVFNRWGNLVFETSDLDINWDGKDGESGAELSNGVYFYTCEVQQQFLNEIRVEKLKGTVTIIR